MFKFKRKVKCSQFPGSLGVILVTAVVTTFVVGSVIYVWQNVSNSRTEYELESEVNLLNEKILNIVTPKDGSVKAPKTTSVETSVIVTEPTTTKPRVLVPPSPEEEIIGEVKFDNCGKLSLFIYEDWYPEFRDGIQKQFVQPSDITSVCHSDNANMLIALAEGLDCKSPAVFKFNTNTKTLGRARIDGKGVSCLSSPEMFGKRDGNVIHLRAEGSDASCSWKNYYDYNFITNVFALKDRFLICQGDVEGNWTEY
ncbi:hypothetical protein ACFL6I_11430 [candidate division KSB1 bacterium]